MAPKTAIKAITDREDGEVWTEDGITYEMVFGLPKITGVTGYTETEVDDGQTVDFDTDPIFVGTYRGVRTVPNEESGQDQLLHLLTAKDGRNYVAWGSYLLNKGLAEVKTGASVVVEYTGTRDISKGRSIKGFRVFSK